MNITKAIIHSVDEILKTILFSDYPLALGSSPEVEAYLEKMVKGFSGSVQISKAELGDTSLLYPLIGEKIEGFVDISKDLTKAWYEDVLYSQAVGGVSVIVVQVDMEDASYLMFLEFKNKVGFIKTSQNIHQQGLENALILNQAILPTTFSSVQAGFLLNLNDGSLQLKYRDFDLQERLETLLDTQVKANSKTTFEVVNTLVHYISEKREEDSFVNTIKAKQVINDNVEAFDGIEANQVLTEVFENLSLEENETVEASFTQHNIVDLIDLKQMKRSSLTKKHRIQTESGIEIILPLDSLEVQNMVDIETDINGSVTISLKDVGKILQ